MVGLALSPLIGKWVGHALGVSAAGAATACVIGTFAFFWLMFDVAVVVTNAVHGALVNDAGHAYLIRDGVPDFRDTSRETMSDGERQEDGVSNK